MFSWADIPSMQSLKKCMSALRRVMSFDNYGFDDGNWNLTGIIKSPDQRAAVCMMILEGKLSNQVYSESELIRGPDGEVMKFKLQVLSRQACKFDKNGNRIFKSKEAQDKSGEEGSIVAEYTDPPQEGDVIQFKIGLKHTDDDGEEMNARKLMSLAMDGQAIHTMRNASVDRNGCISIPCPYAVMALRRNGHRVSFPEFAGQYKPRKVTNWWFKEVPLDFKRNRSRKDEQPTKEGIKDGKIEMHS